MKNSAKDLTCFKESEYLGLRLRATMLLKGYEVMCMYEKLQNYLHITLSWCNNFVLHESYINF